MGIRCSTIGLKGVVIPSKKSIISFISFFLLFQLMQTSIQIPKAKDGVQWDLQSYPVLMTKQVRPLFKLTFCIKAY